MSNLSRRSLLQLGAAGLVAAPLLKDSWLAPASAQEKASVLPASSGPLGFYRFKIGDLNAVVLSDGASRFPKPHPTFAPEASPQQFQRALAEYFLPSDSLNISFNILGIEHAPGKWALIDAGARDLMDPSLGKLPLAMAGAGIAPADVSDVFLSHAHFDHFGGIFAADGTPLFSNANLHAHSAEVDFWAKSPDLSKMPFDAATRTAFITGAQNFFRLAQPRLTRFSGGQTFLGCITSVHLPGHTPGHSGFLIQSKGESLLNLVDMGHHYVLAFSHPQWTVGFDSDRPLARTTRLRSLAQYERDRTRILGYHFPFPGIGHVRSYKKNYEFVPEHMTTL